MSQKQDWPLFKSIIHSTIYFSFDQLKLGQSPVEWGEIPFVHPFVHHPQLALRPLGWPSDPSSWPSDPAGWPLDTAGWPSDPTSWPLDPSSWPSDPSSWSLNPLDGRMDKRNFSPLYRTLSPVGAAALLLSET